MNVQDFILGLRQSFSGGSQTAIILLVVSVLILLVVGIVVLALMQGRTPRGRIEQLLEDRAQDRNATRWPTRIVIVSAILVAFLVTGFYVGRPSTCNQCHRKTNYSKSLAASPHKGTACLKCHAETGVTMPLLVASDYVRWMFVYASEKQEPKPKPGSMQPSQCLRCHSDIREGTTTSNGIRVRHADFLASNGDCRRCHNAVAHGDSTQHPTSPTMNGCVVCHDGTTASADCETCHVKGLYEVTNLGSLPKVTKVDTTGCYQCHEEEPCTRCHGVTMPHPEGWTGGGALSTFHARDGFAHRDRCWRCHFEPGKPFEASDKSCRCHGLLGRMHGGEAWIREHGLEASGAKPGVDNQCFTCHPSHFCDYCHPPSYGKERYNPSSEPVNEPNYQRDIPFDPNYWEY